MKHRDKTLATILPVIPTALSTEETRSAEIFQNEVLRPILKYQHQVFMLVFKHYSPFLDQINIAKTDYIVLRQKVAAQLSKNQKLRNQLLGMVIGLMTTEQLQTYFIEEKELRKRIFSMLTERIIDGLYHKNNSAST